METIVAYNPKLTFSAMGQRVEIHNKQQTEKSIPVLQLSN
jgi:hypothetical protein